LLQGNTERKVRQRNLFFLTERRKMLHCTIFRRFTRFSVKSMTHQWVLLATACDTGIGWTVPANTR
jgi:hypothetical protein